MQIILKRSFFKNTCFPSVIIESNKLEPEIQSTPSLNIFKKNFLKFIRLTANNIFSCQTLKFIKYLRGLRLGLSHLHEHRFKSNFPETLDPLCIGGYVVENTCHFLLYCPYFLAERNFLLNKIADILIVIF